MWVLVVNGIAPPGQETLRGWDVGSPARLLNALVVLRLAVWWWAGGFQSSGWLSKIWALHIRRHLVFRAPKKGP